MSGYFTESNYENAVLQLLNKELGYTYRLVDVFNSSLVSILGALR